jgi:hypothetical protein
MSLLRHTLATLAYRAGKAVRGMTPEACEYRSGGDGPTPRQILAHMGDLMDWALSMAQGKPQWRDAEPLAWDGEVARFFAALKKFDDYLASGQTVHATEERLFQGPVADALTHTGQIAMLRRLGGAKMMGENYYVAEIVTGRVGAEQAAPVKEF